VEHKPNYKHIAAELRLLADALVTRKAHLESFNLKLDHLQVRPRVGDWAEYAYTGKRELNLVYWLPTNGEEDQ
jgi:hypothetical protein